MTDGKIIKARVAAAKADSEIKRHYYNLRNFFAGNYEALAGEGTSTGSRPGQAGELYPDIWVNSAFPGTSNFTLTVITSLTMMLFVHKPDIVFPHLPTDESNFREAYVRDRLTKGEWVNEQLTGIMDYLINGIACWHVNVNAVESRNTLSKDHSGYPDFVRIDPLNLFTDPTVRYPGRGRFVACLWNLSEEEALARLGPEAVKIAGPNVQGKDRKLKVIEYWDRDTRALLHPSSCEPLLIEDNGMGFVPFEFWHGLVPPSFACPLPHIVNMIGSQVDYNETQKTISEISKTLKPYVIIDATAFTPASLAAYEAGDGDLSVLVVQDPSKPGITVVKPGQIDQSLIALLQNFEKQLTQAGQFNPYTLGASQNPEFAAEVDAIQGAAGLFVQHSALKHSLSLAEVFRKMVQIGSRFDMEPFYYERNGNPLRLNFRPRDYPEDRQFFPKDLINILREDVPCEVTVAPFENPLTKAARATQILGIVEKVPSIATPQLARRQLEIILEAQGERDIQGLLTPQEAEEKAALVKEIPLQQLQQFIQMGVQAMQQQQQAPPQ